MLTQCKIETEIICMFTIIYMKIYGIEACSKYTFERRTKIKLGRERCSQESGELQLLNLKKKVLVVCSSEVHAVVAIF